MAGGRYRGRGGGAGRLSGGSPRSGPGRGFGALRGRRPIGLRRRLIRAGIQISPTGIGSLAGVGRSLRHRRGHSSSNPDGDVRGERRGRPRDKGSQCHQPVTERRIPDTGTTWCTSGPSKLERVSVLRSCGHSPMPSRHRAVGSVAARASRSRSIPEKPVTASRHCTSRTPKSPPNMVDGAPALGNVVLTTSAIPHALISLERLFSHTIFE